MERYLIPRRITQGYELFPGWTGREIKLVAAALVLGALLFLLAGLLRLPLALHIGLPLVIVAGTAAAVRPRPTGESLLDEWLRIFAYSRARRLYLYDFGRDDV